MSTILKFFLICGILFTGVAIANMMQHDHLSLPYRLCAKVLTYVNR